MALLIQSLLLLQVVRAEMACTVAEALKNWARLAQTSSH